MSSAALVGASVIAISPALTPPLPEHAKAQLSDVAVQLAANSIANIPLNLFHILADIPINQLNGLNAASASLEGSGNWWLYGPNNALGWDQMDYAKAIGFTQMLTPIPEVAQAQADQINAIMARNFPMTRSCTGIPGPCSDPYYFTAYFTTPLKEALFGYSYHFGPVYNSIDPNLEMPWSNQTLTYDPFGPAKALWDALTKTPDPNWQYQQPNFQDQLQAQERFLKAVFNSFNPFVPGTYCVPCQIFVPGAPDSLPVINIFGNLYTYLNWGQKFTSQDWNTPHPEVPAAPALQKLPLFSPEARARIRSDAKAYFNWVFKGGPQPQPEMEPPHNWPAIPGPSSTVDTTAVAASTVNSNATVDSTATVTETKQKPAHSLFNLNLGSAAKGASAADTTTTGTDTTTTSTDTTTTGTDTTTTSTDTTTTGTDTTAGAADGSQDQAPKTTRNPFKPWGSSKQRDDSTDSSATDSKKSESTDSAGSADSSKKSDSDKKSSGTDKKQSDSSSKQSSSGKHAA
ncbi:hypothetical protein [Mycolicibacterium chubuense]|nr:hypothetical protein [Mycolicibacterium chubuense]